MDVDSGSACSVRSVVTLAALLLAGTCAPVGAQSPGYGSPPAGLNLSLDVTSLLETGKPSLSLEARPAPPAAAPTARRRVQPSLSREDLAISLNLKGFSLLEMDEQAETQLQFRRIGSRDWRKPLFSITVQSRF